ncbi:hypothetical protein G9A89_013847 [Geosiphon pyriformis]|nr:hypothetical protein G9A89_013847 [Geosiphon pyriformis]
MGICYGDNEKYSTLVEKHYSTKKYETTFLVKEEHTMLHKPFGEEPYSDWTVKMTIDKIEGASSEEIREIKNNLLEPIKLDWDPEPVINLLNPEQFHEHYQKLAPTKEEQEQWLEEINTRLCDYCLIPCDFQYCNECNLIYNPPPHMIYTIPEEEEPINSCASESESTFNLDSNSNNDDNKNNSSSSAQYDKKNNGNSDSNSNPETYIILPDLFKKQKFRWYSDNNKGIILKCVHNTDARFDLRYPGKDTIKLEPHSHTCIDLKIALKIPATTIIQLAFRNSLVKREINIREGIIDAEYAYVIEPNKKIAQAIFLSLVKIAQLVSVGNREKLEIMVRGIQGFRSTGRIDVLGNMAEKKIIDKGEIIFTCQPISILSYNQYIVVIKRKVKDQVQIFEAKATLYKSGEINLVNLYIPAKNYSHIKISIYNNTGNIIEILAGTTIRYLTTKIKDQLSDTIPDFP